MMAAFQVGDHVVRIRQDVKVPMKVAQVDGWTVTCVWTENGEEKRVGFVRDVLER